MPEYLDKFKNNKFRFPTTKYGSYDTVREGEKSITIDYNKNSIKVYSNSYLDKNNEKDNIILQKYLKENKPYEISTHYNEPYLFRKTKFIKEFKNFSKVWLGNDTEIPDYIGNTVLIQTSQPFLKSANPKKEGLRGTSVYRYILISSESIEEFIFNDEILEYYSPFDDETVPCPIALTKDKFIFVLENRAYDRKDINNIVMSKEAKSYRDNKYHGNSPVVYTYLLYNNFFDKLNLETIKFNELDCTKLPRLEYYASLPVKPIPSKISYFYNFLKILVFIILFCIIFTGMAYISRIKT